MRKSLKKEDFIFKQGSKMWPSDDPKYSPIDTYFCKYCGFEIHYQGCGVFHRGQMEKEYNSAETRKAKHRLECEKWPEVDIESTGEITAEKLDTIIDLLRIIANKNIF